VIVKFRVKIQNKLPNEPVRILHIITTATNQRTLTKLLQGGQGSPKEEPLQINESGLTTCHIAITHAWFNGICQLAPVCSPPNNAFLGPPESKSQTVSWLVQPFLHSSRQRVTILYNGLRLSPLKTAISHWGSEPQSNKQFLGPPPESSTQMAPRSVWLVFGDHLQNGSHYAIEPLSVLLRWCIVAKRLNGSRCHLVRR